MVCAFFLLLIPAISTFVSEGNFPSKINTLFLCLPVARHTTLHSEYVSADWHSLLLFTGHFNRPGLLFVSGLARPPSTGICSRAFRIYGQCYSWSTCFTLAQTPAGWWPVLPWVLAGPAFFYVWVHCTPVQSGWTLRHCITMHQ